MHKILLLPSFTLTVLQMNCGMCWKLKIEEQRLEKSLKIKIQHDFVHWQC
jgi:hypothetical protein